MYFLFTLTVPEQAQGASKVSMLSNSSSWQILQRGTPESSFKSSTNKTTSAIYFTPSSDLCFFKFQPLFSNSVGYSVFSFSFLRSLSRSSQESQSLYTNNKTRTFPILPLFLILEEKTNGLIFKRTKPRRLALTLKTWQKRDLLVA